MRVGKSVEIGILKIILRIELSWWWVFSFFKLIVAACCLVPCPNGCSLVYTNSKTTRHTD